MKNYIVVLFTSIFVFCGCQGKEGPVGPTLSGDIVGTVKVVDTLGNYTNLDGVLVQLEETQYSTHSDSSGLWRLVGVKSGTYVLSLSKPGFSTAKNTSFQFIGGIEPTDASYFYLYQIPSVYVKALKSPLLNQNILTINGTLSSIPGPNYSQAIVIFAGPDSNATMLANKHLSVYSQYFAATDTFSTQLYFGFFKTAGMTTGSKLYFVGYTAANMYAGYKDVATQEFVFSGLCSKPSNIVSLVVP